MTFLAEDELNMRNKFLKIASNNRIFLILLFLIIVISIADISFLSITNILNLLTHIAINGIIALAMSILLISGSFDLSVGSVLSISGIIAIILQSRFGLITSIIIAILAGCLIGLINGLIVTYGKINAFITTLGMMIIIKGLALTISNGFPVINSIEKFKIIGLGQIFLIPYPIIYFIIFILIFLFIMKWTTFGRNVYAIGGNELGAKLSGININLYKILYFVLSGFCASISGIILSSRLNTGSAIFGDNTPLIVISAVILGGISLEGGVGTIFGTILGISIIGVVENGMELLNIVSYYQLIIRGSVLVIVVLIDAYYIRMKERGRLIN